MSAINPASFASPSLGLQAPSGIGPGAVGVSRTTQPSQRQQQPEQTQAQAYNNTTAARNYQTGFTPFQSTLDRNAMAAPAFQPSGFAYYTPFTPQTRNGPLPQAGYMASPMMDPFAGFHGASTSEYQGLPPRFPSPGLGGSGHESDYSRQVSGIGRGIGTPSDAWISSFQGLSMNTR